MDVRDCMEKRIAFAMVPDQIKESLARYVNHRIATGSFLQAVLENDLRGALAKGDSENRAALKDIVKYVNWELPSECHGSIERVRAWLNGGHTQFVLKEKL